MVAVGRRNVTKRMVFGLLLGAVLAGGLLCDISAWPENRFPVASNSEKMRYILFPTDPDGILQRAVIVDGQELFDGDRVEYYENNRGVAIDKKALSLLPPADPREMAQYIARLNVEIARWGDGTDYENVSYATAGDRIEVFLKFKRGKSTKYSYRIVREWLPIDAEIKIFM